LNEEHLCKHSNFNIFNYINNLYNNYIIVIDIFSNRVAQSIILIVKEEFRKYHNDFKKFSHDIIYLAYDSPSFYEK
jgi:hypothetical protein